MTPDERALVEELKTAVHEAGHSVAAYLGGVPFERVTILSHEEFEQMEGDPSSWAKKPQGEVIIEHTREFEFVEADGVRRPTDDTSKAIEAYIVYSLAGQEAEAVLCGERAASGDDADMAKLHVELDALAEDVQESGNHQPVDCPWLSRGAGRNAQIERVRACTTALLRQYQCAVRAVATALLERRALSHTEVAALVDRWAPR